MGGRLLSSEGSKHAQEYRIICTNGNFRLARAQTDLFINFNGKTHSRRIRQVPTMEPHNSAEGVIEKLI